MVTMASDIGKSPTTYACAPLRDPSTVCYTRSTFTSNEAIRADCGTSPIHYLPRETAGSSTSRQAPSREPVRADSGIKLPSPVRRVTASDFTNHLCAHHPAISANGIGILLREQVARAVLHMNTATNYMLTDMCNFTDKLAERLEGRCLCCPMRGFTSCPILDSAGTAGITERTPVASKISGRRLNLSDADGEASSSNRGSACKRASSEPLCTVAAKKTNLFSGELHNELVSVSALRTELRQHAADVFNSVKVLYGNTNPTLDGTIVFGTSTTTLPKRKYVSNVGYSNNIWMKGYCPPVAVPSHVSAQLEGAIAAATVEELDRFWILHHMPRLLAVTGNSIRDELLGGSEMHHETETALFRRYSQLFMEQNPDRPYMSFAHYFEPDLAISILAAEDYLRLSHVQNQFLGKQYIIRSILATWYKFLYYYRSNRFYMPVPLEQGWVVYVWDMMSKIVHVFDPSKPCGCNNQEKAKHKAAVAVLHYGLFNCLNEYFARWPVKKEKWSTKHEKFGEGPWSRGDSALCVLHVMWYYGGDKLRVPMTQANIENLRKNAVHELMKIQGNHSSIPADMIWKILAPSDEEDF